ncbi:heterokaryon incompatibility protein-domain-containing protein [Fomes fomentarius]|nr:heterokaryon incompatibility protein-domain-containing protein [Fomes fomentarius]
MHASCHGCSANSLAWAIDNMGGCRLSTGQHRCLPLCGGWHFDFEREDFIRFNTRRSFPAWQSTAPGWMTRGVWYIDPEPLSTAPSTLTPPFCPVRVIHDIECSSLPCVSRIYSSTHCPHSTFTMWLLRARTATLEYFVSPEHVPQKREWTGMKIGGYAILSHVWGKNEQTFQDIKALPSQCVPGQTPRDIASEKIRMACMLAEKDGHEWIWIDTCCIDKSSSAELSEAINSMFRYYSLAGVCFAYLEDVSNRYYDPMPKDEFKKSKWHTRGWTLQELIATAKH